MMGEIYNKAKGVAIWLGEAEGDSDLAMTTMANIRSEKDLKALSVEANEAIGNLFQRSWFSRVWTVQEFSLGKHPVFHCGQKSFSWSHIQDVLDDLIPNPSLVPKLQRESKKADTEILDRLSQGHIWHRLFTDRRGVLLDDFGMNIKDKSFCALLEAHIYLQATEDRDRIYGLLALGEKFSKGLKKSPEIDTEADATSVNSAWAKWMIESTKSLDILFLCQQTKAAEGLPSWASTWKVRDPEHFVPRFSAANLRFYASSKIMTSRNSTVPFTSAKFSFSGNILSVEGKLITTLDTRFQFSDVEPEYFREMLTFLPPGYISGEPQSLWDSMLEFSVRTSAPTETFIGLSKIWKVPKDYHAARKRTPARLEKIKLVVSMNRKQLRGPSKMSGIVPKETQMGDILCWIRGIETLFVLRPTGLHYRVVGECFLDGYMGGWKSIGGTRTFELC